MRQLVATAAIGNSGSIGLSFSGLDAGRRSLGSVACCKGGDMPNPPIVRADLGGIVLAE